MKKIKHMTIRELKRELRHLQSQENLSDDADVEIRLWLYLRSLS